MLSPSTLSPRTGSETLMCTIVYCTVKFKGKCESYSIQKKKRIKYCIDNELIVKAPEMDAEMLGLLKWAGGHPSCLFKSPVSFHISLLHCVFPASCFRNIVDSDSSVTIL